MSTGILGTALRVARIPADVRDAVLLVVELGPELRNAVVSLVKALKGGNDAESRQAYEAARRVAFEARQR